MPTMRNIVVIMVIIVIVPIAIAGSPCSGKCTTE